MKKEIEQYTVNMYECPYCDTAYEDDEYWAEQCRDECFEKLENNKNQDEKK